MARVGEPFEIRFTVEEGSDPINLQAENSPAWMTVQSYKNSRSFRAMGTPPRGSSNEAHALRLVATAGNPAVFSEPLEVQINVLPRPGHCEGLLGKTDNCELPAEDNRFDRTIDGDQVFKLHCADPPPSSATITEAKIRIDTGQLHFDPTNCQNNVWCADTLILESNEVENWQILGAQGNASATNCGQSDDGESRRWTEQNPLQIKEFADGRVTVLLHPSPGESYQVDSAFLRIDWEER